MNREQKCVLMGVYYHPELIHQPKLWKLLCSSSSCVGKPWLVIKDFNEVLHLLEKWGGRARFEKQMEEFCEVLTACELRDLGYEGSPFTWCNNREKDGRIFERLNCFLANSLWCDLFLSIRLIMAKWPTPIIVQFGSIPIALGLLEEDLMCLDLRPCRQTMLIVLTLLMRCGRWVMSMGPLGIS